MRNVPAKPKQPPPHVSLPHPPAIHETPNSSTATAQEVLAATENLWKVYGLINDWIKSSDGKAGAIMSANAILIGASVNVLNAVSDVNKMFLLRHHEVLGLMVFALVTVAISIGFCLCCIYPHLGTKNGASLIYFGHIAQRPSAQDYEREVRRTFTNDVEALNEISDQVWINSRIAVKKLRYISFAVIFFSATFLLLVIAALAAKLS